MIAFSYDGKDSSKFETDSAVYGGGGEEKEFLREDCSTRSATVVKLGISRRFLERARAKNQINYQCKIRNRLTASTFSPYHTTHANTN